MTYTSTSTTTRWAPWRFREQDWQTMDLTDFKVEARDGEIGKVDRASKEIDGSYLIVDTGTWIFGKKVMLPAGIVDHVDLDGLRLIVNRTKEQIKNAPEFDEKMIGNLEYHERFGTYYGETGPGWYEGR